MNNYAFHAPASVEEAVGLLAEMGPAAVVLAGGTDVMVRARRGTFPDSVTSLLSVHRIAEMRGVRQSGDELVIGATTTATDLIRDPLVANKAPILAQVADRMASDQIRNVATVGGNVVNASPAGDLINPLLLLDAQAVLKSATGSRTVPVHELFIGPGETVLLPHELLVALRFQIPPEDRVFAFEKAGTRPAMECSVLTVGLAFTVCEERLTNVRVVFGSAAPTPIRGRLSEAALEGQRWTPEVIESAVRAADEDVSPISDIRAGECYRRALAGVFLRRLLNPKSVATGADEE